MLMINFKQGQQWEEICPWSGKEKGVQEQSAPERLSKVTERPGQREGREEKKPAKDRNQQSLWLNQNEAPKPHQLFSKSQFRGPIKRFIGSSNTGNYRSVRSFNQLVQLILCGSCGVLCREIRLTLLTLSELVVLRYQLYLAALICLPCLSAQVYSRCAMCIIPSG